MKFKIGDEIDSSLATTLTHELLQCEECLEAFKKYGCLNMMGNRQKIIILKSFNSYLGFLHHLYEFYVGCFKRDRKDMEKIEAGRLDWLFTNEVEKLLRIRRERIKRGDASRWENHISYYDIPVLPEFASSFRIFRNIRAHVKIERVKSKGITLLDFFERYHRFIYLLYESAREWWSVKNIESLNWKEIEQFNFTAKGGS